MLGANGGNFGYMQHSGTVGGHAAGGMGAAHHHSRPAAAAAALFLPTYKLATAYGGSWGFGHHTMVSNLYVVEKGQGRPGDEGAQDNAEQKNERGEK